VAIATAPFLPFVDLPQHVAAARLLGQLHQPETVALYEARLVPQVNVLGLFVSTPLLRTLPENATVRVIVVLYIAGLAAALGRLARAAGASSWSAVAAMVLALHFDWMYGFLSFCLGLPILLFVLARLAETMNRPAAPLQGPAARLTVRTWLIDAALWLTVVWAHTLLLAFGVAALAVWTALSSSPRKLRFARSLAVGPALFWLLASLGAARRASGSTAGAANGLEAIWESPGTKMAEIGRALLVASSPGWLEAAVLTGLTLFAVACVWSERKRRRPLPPGRRWLRWVALLAVLAYAALPYSIYERQHVTTGLFILYQRFLVLAPLVYLPTLDWPGRSGGLATLRVVVLLANVAVAWNWHALFARVGRQADGLDAAIASIPPGRKLKSLVYTPYPEGCRFESFLHVASYYQARQLGETDQSFTLLPTSPIHYRDPARPYLSRNDEHLRPQEFDFQGASLYDAILVYDRSGAWMTAATAPWPVRFERNGWIVLEPPR
jgi:hypothetical protein